MLKLLEKLLLHAHVVVGDGQHGDSIRTRGLVPAFPSSARNRGPAPKQLFLQENERRLGVLQGSLMPPDLRKHRACVEVGVSRVLYPRSLLGSVVAVDFADTSEKLRA